MRTRIMAPGKINESIASIILRKENKKIYRLTAVCIRHMLLTMTVSKQ